MSTTTAPLQTEEPKTATKRAADRIVETLQAFGVKWVFGVPGAKIDPVYDALAAVDTPQMIPCRNEQNAAFMAAAVGRLTGVPGVALVTSGPGTSNLATGLVTATTEGDPMVAICGSVRRADHLKRTHQTMDAVGLLSTVTKSATEVTTADNVVEALTNAFRSSLHAPRGATAVVLPYDVSLGDTEVRVSENLTAVPQSVAIDDVLVRIAQLTKDAKFPVILAGARAGDDKTVEALHELLRKTDLPVVETFQAAGIVSHELEDHYLGRVGFARNQPGDVLLNRADVVIAVGYDFVEYEPAIWNPDCTRTIVNIDEIPADIDNCYRPAAEAVGQIPSSIERLTKLLEGLKMPTAAAQVVDQERERLAHEDLGDPNHDDSKGLDPVAVIAKMRSAAPDDSIVLCDVGSHYLFMARHFRTYHPRSLQFSNGQQTLGVALPWAMAAALSKPERPVLSVSGDGGFLFSGAELETAVRLGLKFTHIIFNDGTYDMVAFQQMNKYGRTSGIQLGHYDVVKYAESFGANGHRVTKIEDLEDTIKQAMAEDGPSLIDVPVDYSDNLAKLGGDLLADILL